MVDSPWSNVESIVTAAAPVNESPWSNVETITTLGAGVTAATGYSNVQTIVTSGPITYLVEPSDGSLTPCYVFYMADDGLVPDWPFNDPTPVAITIDDFTRTTVSATGAIFTFTTNEGIPVTRIMEWRRAGTTAWTTFGNPTQRTTTHTAGYTGLPSSAAIQTRMTFSAAGFETRVIDYTTPGFEAMAFTTAAAPTAPGPTMPKLRYAPPVLDNPLVYQVPVNGGSYNGLAGRDVIWVMPDQPVTGQLSIFGGRHHVLIGGEFRAGSTLQSCLKIEQYTGTVHVEGVVMDPTGGYGNTPEKDLVARRQGPPFMGDGIRTNSTQPGSHFVLQNCWGQVNGAFDDPNTPNDGNDGPHGDFMQNWSGPFRMSVDRCTVQTWYQGFFCYVDQPGFSFASQGLVAGPYRFSNVDVWRRVSGGGARAWEVNGPETIVIENCYARRDPGSSTSIVASNSSSAELDWIVSESAPPGGSFVDRTKVGIGYVSPGYLSDDTYDGAVLNDEPVGYWPGTSGVDVVGGRNATFFGTSTTTTMPNGDTARDFDGATGYAQVADSPLWSVPTTGRLTVEAWLRPDVVEFPNDEATGYVHWAGKGTASGVSGNREWAARMYSLTNTEGRPSRISGYAFNPEGSLGTGAFWQDPLTAGQWLHYTLVINTADKGGAYPNGYVLVRKNGVERQKVDLNDTVPVTPTDGSAPMRWGTREFQSFFAGAIGKFAVYDYELPAARSLLHYQRGSGT